jgi:hypothetical protein
MSLTTGYPMPVHALSASAIPLDVPSRINLFTALMFIDAPPTNAPALLAWFSAYPVLPGDMLRPTQVTETLCSAVALDPEAEPTTGSPARVEALVATAHARVLRALSELIAPERNDRFISSLVAAGRVRHNAALQTWEAHPDERDPLSDIVLTLLAADILSNRAFYDAYLCVCKTCFQVSFEPTRTGRTGCVEHRPTGICRRGAFLHFG